MGPSEEKDSSGGPNLTIDPRIFGPEAGEDLLGHDGRLELTDPETVHLVTAGFVDLFALNRENGRLAGRRRELFRVGPGRALFGLDSGSEERGVGLLASAGPDVRVIKLNRARLTDPSVDQAIRRAGVELIDGWLTTLQTALVQDPPPTRYTGLTGLGETTAEADSVLRPEGGLVWVKPTTGSFRLGGPDPGYILPAGRYFPLSPAAWLEVADEGRLSTVASADLVARGDLDQALDHGQAALLELINLKLAQEAEQERDRLTAGQAADRSFLSNGLRKIAAVLGGREEDPFQGGLTGDHLLDACRLVGRVQGIEIVAPVKKAGRAEQLTGIARASGIRFRRVVLRGQWYKEDNGPLLGQLKDGRRPVALLPASPGSYFLVDPATKSKIVIGPQEAESLRPGAAVLYRPFPDRALTWKDLLKFSLLGSTKDFRRVVALGLLVGLLGLIAPIAAGIIFNEIIPRAMIGYLWQIGLILLVCHLAAAMLTFVRNIAVLRMEGRMDGLTQAAVWDRLLNLPTDFFRSYSSGDLTMRAMGVESIRRIVSGATVTNILAGIFSLFNLALLFYYSAPLAFLAIGLITTAAVVTLVAGWLQVRWQRRVINIQGRITSLVRQIVQGLAKIRLAGAQDRALAVWADRFSAQKKEAYRAGRAANILTAFNSAFPLLALAAVFAWIIFKGQGQLSVGDFLAFNAALSNFLAGTLQMSGSLISLLHAVPFYERLKPILEAEPEVDRSKTDPGPLTGRLELNRVSFRYGAQGPWIVRDLSLTIEPGAFVALVGPSGAGKSTLLRLLLGFETPDSGAIYYDNFDLAAVDVHRVRRQIGVVLQTAQVMPGDILNNIVGSSGLGRDEAWEAARAAGLAEDIEAMPMGLGTLVNEGGSTLSGGQRQRLIIARALVRKPRIIFFDEATSALDNRTQAEVQQSLASLKATRLVIAHRLSTIVRADRIIVLDQGRIVETGTYDELTNQSGLFREMVRRQLF